MKYIKRKDGKFAGSYPKGTVSIHHNYKQGSPVEHWNPKEKTMQTKGFFRRMSDRITNAIRWSIRTTLRLTLYTGVVAAVVLIIGLSFRAAFPNYVKAVETVEVESPAPVLDRIADCESGLRNKDGSAVKGSATHYGKNGQVLVKAVMTGDYAGTIDVGKYQVNVSIWGQKATDLKLDVFDEKDNFTMAQWIYKNNGTGDWSASAKCWKR